LLQNALSISRQIEPEHLNGSGSRCDDPEQHLNRGGLPRSIWTQQSKNFSRSDVERNIVDGEEFAKLFDQTLHMQNGRGHECQSVTRVTATCELKSRAMAWQPTPNVGYLV
jgi:hypothetical protein